MREYQCMQLIPTTPCLMVGVRAVFMPGGVIRASQYRSIVLKRGGHVDESPSYATTHLVCHSYGSVCQMWSKPWIRLLALRGMHVVRGRWVRASLQAGRLLPEGDFDLFECWDKKKSTTGQLADKIPDPNHSPDNREEDLTTEWQTTSGPDISDTDFDSLSEGDSE